MTKINRRGSTSVKSKVDEEIELVLKESGRESETSEEDTMAGKMGLGSDGLQRPDPSVSGEHLTYPIFFMMGLGTLFPWNAFINATSYFSARFCGTSREEDYLAFFSVAFNVTEVAALACCVKFGWKQVRARRTSRRGSVSEKSNAIFLLPHPPVTLTLIPHPTRSSLPSLSTPLSFS